jgi:hypothetical protein
MNVADPLQANATIIAGILIFLTISPLVRGSLEAVRRGAIISAACVPILLLISSTGMILFEGTTQLDIAKLVFFCGLLGLLLAVLVVLFLDEIFELSERIIRRQSGSEV